MSTERGRDTMRGILLGVAYGDAWGYPNEGMHYEKLLAVRGWGPDLSVPEALIVSDDTQQTLALAEALHGAAGAAPDQIQASVIGGLLTWLHDPDMRGYGRTTITALTALDRGEPWYEATVADSSACGAVMRVAAFAMLAEGLWQPASAWQAACTHGGAEAIAAAALATALLRRVIAGESGDLLACAIELSRDDGLARAAAGWLDEHPLVTDYYDGSAADLIRAGMESVRAALVRAQRALPMFREDPWCTDPSMAILGGEGWLAKDALACALLCVDMFPGAAEEVIHRTSITGGDSDTIGAIAGMFVGARYGDVWPADWFGRLEPRYQAGIVAAAVYRYRC